MPAEAGADGIERSTAVGRGAAVAARLAMAGFALTARVAPPGGFVLTAGFATAAGFAINGPAMALALGDACRAGAGQLLCKLAGEFATTATPTEMAAATAPRRKPCRCGRKSGNSPGSRGTS